MSTKKKVFLVVAFIILDIVLVVTFLSVRDVTMLNDLKKEVNELNKLDISKDRYNRKIVTKGNYAIVEKAIKKYLDDYAVLLQDSLKVVKDPTLTSILSYDNYASDGPDFVKSLDYLKNSKESFNKNIDLLLSDLEEDTIKNYINDKTDNQYYIDLYRDLMLNDDMKDSFSETKELLLHSKTQMNNIFDTSSEALTFLVNNKDNWKLEDNQIKFLEEDLYNQYIGILSKIKTSN
jgi:hypothetical protein